MADLRTIDRDHTAVLIMDYQNDIVNAIAAHQPQLLERAAAVLSGARLAGVPVIYVVVRFRPGYPEVSDRNVIFRGLKAAGRLGEGTPGVEIHPQVAPQPTEVIVTKRRVGAFATTDRFPDIKLHTEWPDEVISKISLDHQPALLANGIGVAPLASCGARDRRALARHFGRRVQPLLTPIAVSAAAPFPYLRSLALGLSGKYVRCRSKKGRSWLISSLNRFITCRR